MIRFVDIRSQGVGSRFAFWDTITNKFFEFDGEQAWNNWDEFLEVAKDDSKLGRFESVSKDWIFDNEEDDIEGFYDA